MILFLLTVCKNNHFSPLSQMFYEFFLFFNLKSATNSH